jgi:hypothetical protein
MQFTLGPPAPAANAAAAPPPGYPPTPNAPTAPPGYPPGYGAPLPPPEEPVNPELEEVGRKAVEERDPDAPLPGRRTNKAQVFILAGIASVLMAGTALTLFFKLTQKKDADTERAGTVISDINIRIGDIPTGWMHDDAMKVKLKSPFVRSYRRENPEAYIAFGASEAPKGHAPRLSDMRADLDQSLRQIFVHERENDMVRPTTPAATSWLGEAIAQGDPYPNGFTFRAQSLDSLNWQGEAYMVSNRGIAYYWLAWCGEKDYESLKGEFAAFRDAFKLMDTRNNWKEMQSNVIDYKGDKVNYTISDAEDQWKEISPERFEALKPLEPDLDRRLEMSITPRRDRKAIPDTAELNVFVLDGNGDPLQVARKYVQDRETARIQTLNPGFTPPTFKERTMQPEGDPTPPNVPSSTPVVRLESNVAESRSAARLIVASGLKVDNKIVVVECWCPFNRRGVFETKFIQIASSLR